MSRQSTLTAEEQDAWKQAFMLHDQFSGRVNEPDDFPALAEAAKNAWLRGGKNQLMMRLCHALIDYFNDLYVIREKKGNAV